ncbi:MAG: cytochrome c oxidase subunit II [Acidimicrobiales bacterium]
MADRRRRPTLGASLVLVAALLTACAHAAPSALDPHGRGAERVAGLWWLLLAVAAAVFVFVMAVLGVALMRRRPVRFGGMGLVIGGGVVLPLAVLPIMFYLSTSSLARSDSIQRRAQMEIEVIGHQWWWEVRYPGGGVTANDIHIPTGEVVRVKLRSPDVNHSLWVPQLQVKTDLIPGYDNVMWLDARRPGTYRGACAEFCGIQHARMAFFVIADPPDQFRTWLAEQAQPAAEPTTPALAAGRDAFMANPCAACHTIRGTHAAGVVGPDLTHFASRRSIGAGTLDNTRGALAGWILNSQTAKRGNIMPPIQLSPQDLQSLLDYLESLR